MYNNINMNSSQMPGMSSGLPGINPFLGGMNPGFGMLSEMIPGEGVYGWILIFENSDDKKCLSIRISEQKLVKEAINIYYLKAGGMDGCTFYYNNKELIGEMKICQSGLNNLSRIIVVRDDRFYDRFVDIDSFGLRLIFVDSVDEKCLLIRISGEKLVKEAINIYYLKTGRMDNCKFIYNSKKLSGEMTMFESGLTHNSRIFVVGPNDDSHGWALIFENEEDKKKNFAIRISEQKLVKEAISIYMLKSGRTDKCKFIYNNKELFGEMRIDQSGLCNMSKIIVVPLSLDSIPFRNNNSSNHNLNPQMNNFNQNYYESQINELKEQLTKEKNKNSILMNENAKLNEMINNMNSNQLFLNNKISFLENELNKKNMEIQNYLNNMNNINNYNINDLVTSINPGEKIITVNFVSNGFQDIANYSIPCKNTSLFIRLEEKLNNDFPQLKNHETFFVVNTRRIKRFQTLEENQIKSNDVISIFTIDA